MPRIVTLTANPALDYSAETEEVAPNRKLRCEAPRVDPGGGGINVARAVGRLGGETLAIYPAGGALGAALAAAVEAEGVLSRVVAVAGPTRLSFTARATKEAAEYRFTLPGEALSESERDALLSAVETETKKGDYLVGSGSLPPGGPDDFWARAARIAKDKGARFVLDTTKGEAEAIEEGLYLLRKNKHEMAETAGRPLQWPDEAAAFAKEFVAARNVERLVLTHGGDGALMATAKNISRASGFSGPVVSAVGAGDSFVAALVLALANGEDDERALRWGMAAASAALETPGTELFDPARVKALVESERN